VFRLGVDYGTSNVVAVLRRPDGRSQPLLFDGVPLLPAAVYAAPDGRLVTGVEAQRNARVEPARYEPNPKRRIDDGEIFLGDRAWPLIEVVAATLGRVAAEAARTLGRPAGPSSLAGLELTMTCPVEWGSARRAVLVEAAGRAGLPPPTLVAEPVAAATYMATVLGRQVPPGRALVVYDLGAGTFDACVVRRTPTGFEPLASRGLADFGGVDLDALVVRRVLDAVARSAPEASRRLGDPADAEDRRRFRALSDDARAAKETLSRQPQATLFVPVAERDVPVSRAEFERLARPALEQTVRVTLATVTQARVTPADIAGIFLVGGSSRVPLVAQLLRQATGTTPVTIEQPELVVAEGALHSAELVSHASPATPPVPALHGMQPAPSPPPMAPSGLGGYLPPPVRLRKSSKKLILGLAGGFIALLLVAIGIAGFTVLGNSGNHDKTMALYRKLGKPAGFSEQSGQPTFVHPTYLKSVLKASSSSGGDPAQATADWLTKFDGNTAPDRATVEENFRNAQSWFPNGFDPHDVTLHLSGSGDTYRIDVTIIY
jgi:molecular chaperone DnaK